MGNIKFYVGVTILILILIGLFFYYFNKNKKNIRKKEIILYEDKIKSDLKQLREKLSKSNDPTDKNEILKKINNIINNFES